VIFCTSATGICAKCAGRVALAATFFFITEQYRSALDTGEILCRRALP